jgi:pimeloyl-ACP methyl ester carboxylesterase
LLLISSTALPFQRPAPKAGALQRPTFDFRSQITKLWDPIDPESPFMVEWYSSPTRVDAGLLRRKRRDAAAIPVGVWLAVLAQGMTDMDLQRSLPRLKAPTLLIWGSDDAIIDGAGRDVLRAGLPAARVKIFEYLGHNPFWEDPHGVAVVINAFLGAKR